MKKINLKIQTKNKNKGFSLIEIIVFLSTIFILIAIVFIFLKPQTQLAQSRNLQRRTDVDSILNAIFLYYKDNNSLPKGIVSAEDCFITPAAEICRTDNPTANCLTGVNLSDLTKGSRYLISIPHDPSGSTQDTTGYSVIKSKDNKITVCAPFSENGERILKTQ